MNTIHSGNYIFDETETMEYVKIPSSVSGLNVVLLIDDSSSYRRWNHPLWAIVKNGYEKDTNDYLAFSVEKNPKILNNPRNVFMSQHDINAVKKFISKYCLSITQVANEKLDNFVFLKNLRNKSYSLTEEKIVLLEMPVIRSRVTNLPTDIWVDTIDRKMKHTHRIKFKAEQGENNPRNWPSISLYEPYDVYNYDNIKKPDISRSEIESIRRFVITFNKELFRLIQDDDYGLDEFVQDIVNKRTQNLLI